MVRKVFFLQDSFCFFHSLLSWQRHNILDFVSGVTRLHVTLANLRSLLCVFNRRSVKQPVAYFLLLHRADETPPGRNRCLAVAIVYFQFWLYHVTVSLSFLPSNQPCFVGVVRPSPLRYSYFLDNWGRHLEQYQMPCNINCPTCFLAKTSCLWSLLEANRYYKLIIN